LKSAGLLRKGQILGAFMDHGTEAEPDITDDDADDDLLEDGLLDAGYDGDDNVAV